MISPDLSPTGIPYAFVKTNGVVVTRLNSCLAEVSVRSGAQAGALAELRRVLNVHLRARRMNADEFDELVSTLYNGTSSGAATLVDDFAQDIDLSRLLQELPKIEDLLRSEEHTSELQSPCNLVCRLLLEKKK